jgi:hypothetical protein
MKNKLLFFFVPKFMFSTMTLPDHNESWLYQTHLASPNQFFKTEFDFIYDCRVLNKNFNNIYPRCLKTVK